MIHSRFWAGGLQVQDQACRDDDSDALWPASDDDEAAAGPSGAGRRHKETPDVPCHTLGAEEGMGTRSSVARSYTLFINARLNALNCACHAAPWAWQGAIPARVGVVLGPDG